MEAPGSPTSPMGNRPTTAAVRTDISTIQQCLDLNAQCLAAVQRKLHLLRATRAAMSSLIQPDNENHDQLQHIRSSHFEEVDAEDVPLNVINPAMMTRDALHAMMIARCVQAPTVAAVTSEAQQTNRIAHIKQEMKERSDESQRGRNSGAISTSEIQQVVRELRLGHRNHKKAADEPLDQTFEIDFDTSGDVYLTAQSIIAEVNQRLYPLRGSKHQRTNDDEHVPTDSEDKGLGAATAVPPPAAPFSQYPIIFSARYIKPVMNHKPGLARGQMHSIFDPCFQRKRKRIARSKSRNCDDERHTQPHDSESQFDDDEPLFTAQTNAPTAPTLFQNISTQCNFGTLSKTKVNIQSNTSAQKSQKWSFSEFFKN